MSRRERPVGRLRAAGAAAALLLLIAGVGAGLGLLRHTDELGEDAPAAEIADPRTVLECAEPAPREGLERDEADPLAPSPTDEVAAVVSSAALLDCPQVFDGRRVVFRGEAVGQVLGRGDHVWLQVNDDVYAGEVGPLPQHRVYAGINAGLGISLPPALTAQLTHRGGPRTQGDRVEVQGVFRRVDPVSGEMAVIVADELEVLAIGRALPVEERTDRAVVAYVLLAIAAGLGLTQRRLRDR